MACWQQQCIIGVCRSEPLRVNTICTIEFTPGTIPHAVCTLHYTVSASSFLLLDRVARNQEWQMWVNKRVLRWLDRGAAAALILRVVFFFFFLMSYIKFQKSDATLMQGKTEMQNVYLNHGPTRPWRAPARSRGCGGADRRAPSALTSQPAEASESVNTWRCDREVSAAAEKVHPVVRIWQRLRFPPFPPRGSKGSCSSASDLEALPCCYPQGLARQKLSSRGRLCRGAVNTSINA